MTALSVNPHALARGAVNAVHPDEEILLYRSLGNLNVKGRPRPRYAPPVATRAQIQSEGGEDLSHQEMAAESAVIRRFFLDLNSFVAEENQEEALSPAGVIRPLSRGGDLIFRPRDKTWWLVTGLADDFSNSGWVSLRAVLQNTPPELG